MACLCACVSTSSMKVIEMKPTDRLIAVNLDDAGLPPPTPEVEQERRVALFDLLEDNQFAIVDERAPDGPYRLDLSVTDGKLVFNTKTEDDNPLISHYLSLTPFQQIIKDYFQICQSYFDAVKRLPPAQIEAIDMGRRGIHDEGAALLIERLEGKFIVDKQTSRRLFTLICVLHFKG